MEVFDVVGGGASNGSRDSMALMLRRRAKFVFSAGAAPDEASVR